MKELSDYLKSERLKQGLTLKGISERAHVSVNVLQLLEEEKYDRIGTPLLIRSFVRAYCSALGIDPVPLLEKHAKEILACDQQDEGIKRYGIWSRPMPRKGRKGLLLSLLVVFAIVSALYGGTWFSKNRARFYGTQEVTREGYPQQEFPSDLREGKDVAGEGERKKDTSGPVDPAIRGGSEAKDGKAQDGRSPARPAVIEGASPTEVLPDDKPKPAGESVRKHILEIEATQKTWIQVKIDGKKTQDTMLRVGDKRRWEADESVQIVAGNGAGIAMKWDGKNVPNQSKSGKMLRLRLPHPEPARNPANP